MARPQLADAEHAVRRYLMYLEDPGSLVDPDAVQRLEAEVAAASDPLARLRALTALTSARAPEPGAVEEDFIRHAQAWAASEDIPVSSFVEMRVPKRVLDAAFGRNGARRGRGASAPAPARRTRVTAEQVEAALLAMPGAFTNRDAIEATGASPLTVKGAIERLEAQGRLQVAGARPGARGRAAKTWTVT